MDVNDNFSQDEGECQDPSGPIRRTAVFSVWVRASRGYPPFDSWANGRPPRVVRANRANERACKTARVSWMSPYLSLSGPAAEADSRVMLRCDFDSVVWRVCKLKKRRFVWCCPYPPCVVLLSIICCFAVSVVGQVPRVSYFLECCFDLEFSSGKLAV